MLPTLLTPDRIVTGSERRGEGSGIGLAIVRTLADHLGGRVEVQGQLGKGTTFAIEIPAEPVESDGDDEAPDAPTGRVLIVDDRADVLDALASVLDELGFECDRTPPRPSPRTCSPRGPTTPRWSTSRCRSRAARQRAKRRHALHRHELRRGERRRPAPLRRLPRQADRSRRAAPRPARLWLRRPSEPAGALDRGRLTRIRPPRPGLFARPETIGPSPQETPCPPPALP